MNSSQINIGIISQARMTSTRLPGKVLKVIRDKSLLHYHVDRLRESGLPVYIATTINKSDDPIADFCADRSLNCYRGSEQDVLGRFYQCAKENKLDVIVRVTSDCPLIDGALIKENVQFFLDQNDEDLYLSNGIEETFPRGFDFEIFSFASLKDANEHAKSDYQREHVTPFIIENSSGKIKMQNISMRPDSSAYRLTVDTSEDFLLVQKLIEEYNADQLNYFQIIDLLRRHPELAKINQHIKQKSV
jgi:spore coat polysaccharide biosynthesis protein SpsF